MANFKDQTLLVTGASGNFGRIAVEELLAKGATKVIAGSRDTAKVADLVAKGAEARKVDFDDAGSLATAFTGVDRILIVSTDAIGKRVAQQTAAVQAAVTAGVKHIVYISAPAARPDVNAGLVPEHFWTEVAIANSGLDFTVLRNHMYADNNLQGIGAALASGQLFDASGTRGTSFVTRADTARTAAGALLTAEGKEILDVTGPAQVSPEEVAAIFSKLSGKTIARVGLTAQQLREGMAAAGLPAPVIDILVGFQVDASLGYHSIVTDVVERFSGRKPQSLEAFLTENRAAFAA